MTDRTGAWLAEIREIEATMRVMRRRIASLRKSISESKTPRVTLSSGCVHCDLKLAPTLCTDGWQHLLKGGGVVRCAAKNLGE